jgi:hypothetical protein
MMSNAGGMMMITGNARMKRAGGAETKRIARRTLTDDGVMRSGPRSSGDENGSGMTRSNARMAGEVAVRVGISKPYHMLVRCPGWGWNFTSL